MNRCLILWHFAGGTKVEAPQILSKLFPQTSGALDEQAKIEEERKEEEEKKEQQNSWKRMKIG